MTQCAVEEAPELNLGMRGLTGYAETISVYGTERVFIDGDDTPWSKAFLASAYASRGIKMRFTSGTGSEVQMGNAEGKSMLYLEIRCVMVTKGAGVQGLQNGSISCIGVPGAVPVGIRAVLAENLATPARPRVRLGQRPDVLALGHRRTARLLMQFLPGTDFICSGYAACRTTTTCSPARTTTWTTTTTGTWSSSATSRSTAASHLPDDEILATRNKAARALQAVFDQLGFPAITDEEVEAVTYGHGSQDLPDRNVVEDLRAIDDFMKRGTTGLDVVRALAKHGFPEIAEPVLGMLKQKVSGDYLHTSAILDGNFDVLSAVNDPNDYQGPGTGYRLSGERWDRLKDIPQAIRAEDI